MPNVVNLGVSAALAQHPGKPKQTLMHVLKA
jgi:hypothetical protein